MPGESNDGLLDDLETLTEVLCTLRDQTAFFVAARADVVWELHTAGVSYEKIGARMGVSGVAARKTILDRLHADRVTGVTVVDPAA